MNKNLSSIKVNENYFEMTVQDKFRNLENKIEDHELIIQENISHNEKIINNVLNKY